MKLTLEQAHEVMTEWGRLDLRGSNLTELPDGLCVPGTLDLSYSKIKELPEDLCVGASLWLEECSITALPENLTVGGSLGLFCTSIPALPNGLCVGENLFLSNHPIPALPDDIAVGRYVYIYKETHNIRPTNPSKVRVLRKGDYVPGRYLYADGILTHVKSKKELKNGYTLYIGKIPGRNVVSDGKHYAHCDKLRDGIADLLFKSAKDRGADQYKGLSLDTELTVDEAVTMYQIITGACRQGSKDFVDSLGELKERYTIREIMDITKGQYGNNKFREFFNVGQWK